MRTTGGSSRHWASPAERKAIRSTLALASSAPSHVGRCSSHQRRVCSRAAPGRRCGNAGDSAV